MTRKAFIFVNGIMRDGEAIRRSITAEDFLIAVDRGLNHLNAMNLKPHLLIGDLDSIEPADLENIQHQGIAVEKYPIEKDETDLELALQAALKKGFRTIVIVAALGGRTDMTLANMLILTRPDLQGFDVCLEDGIEEVRVVQPEIGISGQAGDIVSLLPLGNPVTGVRTTGLHFPLHGETLWPHQSRGLSNFMVQPAATVRIDSGHLLCIHTRQTPVTVL